MSDVGPTPSPTSLRALHAAWPPGVAPSTQLDLEAPREYRKGDRVAAAIGLVPGIEPPFVGITNYRVAVWVIRDGAVDATIRVPAIAGRVPETERELRALLGGLPDTATIERASSDDAPLPLLPFVAMGALLTAVLTNRRFRRRNLQPPASASGHRR